MVAHVVSEVAALAERLQVLAAAVFRLMIQVRRGQNYRPAAF